METKPIVNIVSTIIWSDLIPIIILFSHPVSEIRIACAAWLSIAFPFTYILLNSKKRFGKTRKIIMAIGPLIVIILAIFWPIAK